MCWRAHDMAALGYTPEVLAFAQVDGVQYGLPWTSSTPVMFYNAERDAAGGRPTRRIRPRRGMRRSRWPLKS